MKEKTNRNEIKTLIKHISRDWELNSSNLISYNSNKKLDIETYACSYECKNYHKYKNLF